MSLVSRHAATNVIDRRPLAPIGRRWGEDHLRWRLTPLEYIDLHPARVPPCPHLYDLIKLYLLRKYDIITVSNLFNLIYMKGGEMQ
jgi:hypothetical protein